MSQGFIGNNFSNVRIDKDFSTNPSLTGHLPDNNNILKFPEQGDILVYQGKDLTNGEPGYWRNYSVTELLNNNSASLWSSNASGELVASSSIEKVVSGSVRIDAGAAVVEFTHSGSSAAYGGSANSDNRIYSNVNGIYIQTAKTTAGVYSEKNMIEIENGSNGRERVYVPIPLYCQNGITFSHISRCFFNHTAAADQLIIGGVWSVVAGNHQISAVANNLHIDCNNTGGLFLNYFNETQGVKIRTVWNASDRRIKKDIEIVDDGEALQKVLALETVKYNYREHETEHKIIGFIAQSVAEVIPEAASKGHGYSAEMMIEVDFSYGQIKENEDGSVEHKIEMIGFDDLVEGQIYRLRYERTNTELVYQDGGFTVNNWVFKSTKLTIIGKVLDDFVSIDKNQIFALHHSAIQELSRKNDRLEAELAAIKAFLNM
jgi:hypothetical protein